MESTAAQVREIISKTTELVETKLKLWKLKAIGKGSEVISSVVSSVVILILVSLAIFLLSIGLSLLIGQWLGEMYLGFLVMAGIYGLAGLLFYIFRKQFIKGPVSDRIVNSVLN